MLVYSINIRVGGISKTTMKRGVYGKDKVYEAKCC